MHLPKAVARVEYPLPSRYMLNQAYNWLKGFNMADRKASAPIPPSYDFLMHHLSDSQREKLDADGGLPWRDWHGAWVEAQKQVDYGRLGLGEVK